MKKKILIKEIDKLTSSLHKDRVISEYLIYVNLDDKSIEAYTEFGEKSKKDRVNELILNHFINDENNKITSEEIIEEINFEDYNK